MKHSESIADLATALAVAQGQLGGAKKDVANPFFKSKYADLASIVDALKACFPANGLSYSQFTTTSDHGVGVETMLMHKSGQWLRGDPFFLPVNKADAQGFGSCLTYARRYDLAAVCGVAPEDDDGNAAAAAKPLPRAIPANVEGVDILAGMPPEEQTFLREQAASIIHLHSINGDMAGWIAEQNYQTEEKLALWGLLPSPVRSAIKKQQRPHLAEQA